MENPIPTNPEVKKFKLGRILLYLLLLGAIVFLAIKLRQSETGRSAHTRKMEKQIKEQQQFIQSLQQTVQSQGSQLREYKPYQAVIRAAALRDSIYKLLPFAFGETVFIMPDSIRATINAVHISGNASEYSIKYLVRTQKGDYQTISITDLKK